MNNTQDPAAERLPWFLRIFLAYVGWTGIGVGLRAGGAPRFLWLIPFKIGKPLLFFALLVARLFRPLKARPQIFNVYVAVGLMAAVNAIFREHSPYFIAADIFFTIYGPLWYEMTCGTQLSRQQLQRIVKIFVGIAVLTYLPGIIVTYTVLIFRSGFYLGYTCIPLIVAAAYYAFSPPRFFQLFAVAVAIFLSGKRAVFLGFLAMMAIVPLGRRDRRHLPTRFMRGMLVAGVFAVGGLMLLQAWGDKPTDSSSLLYRSMHKWELLSPESERGLDVASGGRMAELRCALSEFSATPINYLVGGGLGFSYTLETDSATNPVVYDYRYTHVSYVWLLILYGPLGTLIILAAFGRALVSGYRVRSGREDRHDFALIGGIIGMLVYCVFAANFLIDEALWVFLGLYANPYGYIRASRTDRVSKKVVG